MAGELHDLKAALVRFSEARDWAQFHSPKNLASAVAAEMADVVLYLLNLSEKLDIDLMAASWAKLKANGEKYPVDKAKGSMKKVTEL